MNQLTLLMLWRATSLRLCARAEEEHFHVVDAFLAVGVGVNVEGHAEAPAHIVHVFGAAGYHDEEFPCHIVSAGGCRNKGCRVIEGFSVLYGSDWEVVIGYLESSA